ncbi:MAG: ABC transporter substrate-binding protein [Acidimicrobiia bacterium]|nr:ABC transporter substrate-binding protein [Acidimicrobiia bacterium]
MAEPSYGGELVVGTIFDAFGMEPATFVGGVTDAHIAHAIYDPLVILSPEGEVEPYLAESIESEDQQTWTLTLRSGVRFHDGTPFDAPAVKVNLERHRDPAQRSRSIANARHIESVEVVDPATVRIVLAFPWPAFPEVLANGPLGLMASPAAIAAGTANDQPVGTGPFQLTERVPGDHTTVVRNDAYWQEGKPYLDRIVFRVIVDDAVRQASVEKGEIQAAQSIRGDTLAEAADAPEVKSTQSPGHANTIHINTSAAPMDDVRVRRALALALDTDALDDVIFDGAAPTEGHFLVASSPFFATDVDFPRSDPDAARALLEEVAAERGGPVAFTFSCYTEPSRLKLSELAEQMWEQVGFEVELDISDQMSLVLDLFEKNYTAACFSMGVETSDPDIVYYGTFHSESASNYVAYSNPEMDEALDRGRTSTDPSERAEAYATVQRLLAEDVPVFEYAASPWGWVMGDDVHGLVALPGGEFDPAGVFLAE